MLRFIIERKTLDSSTQMTTVGHYTIDSEVPELEDELTRGGFGDGGYDMCRLIGVEVLAEDAPCTTE